MNIEFQPKFLLYRQIFSSKELEEMHALSSEFPFSKFRQIHRYVEDFSADYAYVSAKIEGCKYTKRGAACLLLHGFTEKGMTLHDAMMLSNIHCTFLSFVRPTPSLSEILTKPFLLETHYKVSDFVLREKARGQIRYCPVRILGSEYLPLSGPEDLDRELDALLATAKSISDPFELAVYLHCNLDYLKLFADCNKRVARLMQSAVMMACNLIPLFLSEEAIATYRTAAVRYYETGDYALYKDLFFKEYTRTLNWLLGRGSMHADTAAY